MLRPKWKDNRMYRQRIGSAVPPQAADQSLTQLKQHRRGKRQAGNQKWTKPGLQLL